METQNFQQKGMIVIRNLHSKATYR